MPENFAKSRKLLSSSFRTTISGDILKRVDSDSRYSSTEGASREAGTKSVKAATETGRL